MAAISGLPISAEARNLHQESVVIDLHVDPIIQQALFGYHLSDAHDPNWQPPKRRWLFNSVQRITKLQKLHCPCFNHIDIPRMLKGGYTFGAFGIHSPPFRSERCWQTIQKQLAYFHELITEDERIILAAEPADIRRAFEQRKLAGFPVVEGVHCLGKPGKETRQKRLDRIDELFNKSGVRTFTLTHFTRNDAATSSPWIGIHKNDGLSEFGNAVIEKMNEVGMIVDLAHANNQGVLDACKVSKKPVVVTHTGIKSINNHSRNISDEALKAVAESGGVVGIIFAMHYLSKDKKNPSSKIILKHIDTIVQNVGEDHAAIGSDFDGWIPRIPEDMQDAADLPVLTQGMLNMGYSPERIKKILGENFLRVWTDILN